MQSSHAPEGVTWSFAATCDVIKPCKQVGYISCFLRLICRFCQRQQALSIASLPYILCEGVFPMDLDRGSMSEMFGEAQKLSIRMLKPYILSHMLSLFKMCSLNGIYWIQISRNQKCSRPSRANYVELSGQLKNGCTIFTT